MELAVRGLVRLLNALDRLNNVKRFDEARIEVGDIAHAADDRLKFALPDARLDLVRDEQGLQALDLRVRRALLKCNDHGKASNTAAPIWVQAASPPRSFVRTPASNTLPTAASIASASTERPKV